MKVGGRRELIIPSERAYGEAGSPPAIGPDETLIFVVDLLDVQPGAAAGAGARSRRLTSAAAVSPRRAGS